MVRGLERPGEAADNCVKVMTQCGTELLFHSRIDTTRWMFAKPCPVLQGTIFPMFQ